MRFRPSINPFYQGAIKRATECLLAQIELPEGKIRQGKAAEVKRAYATLETQHRIARAEEFIILSKQVLQQSESVTKRFRYYAQQELSQVKKCFDAEAVEYPDFRQLFNILSDNGDAPVVARRIASQKVQANHLVLLTDLYRDFDDWLTLLHLIISGRYSKITLITSNEMNGECARITNGFVVHFQALMETLHQRKIDFTVYQGLAAFDFAPLHPDFHHIATGVHYPDKMYSADMRMPKTENTDTVSKGYVDLYEQIRSWGKPVDVISIGKAADLDVFTMLADSVGLSINKITMLGCRPTSVSTNTNGPFYHLQNLPDGMMMLDSRYGRPEEFCIRKETFSAAFQCIAERGDLLAVLGRPLRDDARPIELYLQKVLLQLMQLDSGKILAVSTLEHLSRLHYPLGSTFDLFTLACENLPVISRPIYFACKAEEPERAVCHLGDSPEHKATHVFYPDIDTAHANFMTSLKSLTRPLTTLREKKMRSTIAQYHQDFPLLNHYGNSVDNAQQRAEKTLTKLNEYKLIIRSLFILDVLANNDISDETTANIIAAGFLESEFGFEPLTNPRNMIPNIAYLRSLLKVIDLNAVKNAYIAHDLGKCTSFVAEFNLSPNAVPTAMAHDDYLETFLSRDENANLKRIFKEEKVALFVKILDLLGHAPKQLQATGPFPSLKMVADIAIFVKEEYGESISVKGLSQTIATRLAIMKLLQNKAKALGLNDRTLEHLDPNVAFTALPSDLQNYMAFLMWSGGLRIMSTSDSVALEAFTNAWHREKNAEIVSDMVSLLMKNLEQVDGFCMMYNPTGLLHKTDKELGLKAFLGLKEKGGMGATMDEVVNVAFPFILAETKKAQSTQPTKVAHNEFQVQQLVEMVANMLPDLAGVTVGQNNYRSVDFGTLATNKALAQQLENARSISLSTAQSSRVFSGSIAGQQGEKITAQPALPANQI